MSTLMGLHAHRKLHQKKATKPDCIQLDWTFTDLDIYEHFPIDANDMTIIYRDQANTLPFK